MTDKTPNEAEILADLLNRRPAVNAGLFEEYLHWTEEVYRVMGSIASAPANDTEPIVKTKIPEALRLADCLEGNARGTPWTREEAAAELRRMHARITELEAQQSC